MLCFYDFSDGTESNIGYSLHDALNFDSCNSYLFVVYFYSNAFYMGKLSSSVLEGSTRLRIKVMALNLERHSKKAKSSAAKNNCLERETEV